MVRGHLAPTQHLALAECVGSVQKDAVPADLASSSTAADASLNLASHVWHSFRLADIQTSHMELRVSWGAALNSYVTEETWRHFDFVNVEALEAFAHLPPDSPGPHSTSKTKLPASVQTMPTAEPCLWLVRLLLSHSTVSKDVTPEQHNATARMPSSSSQDLILSHGKLSEVPGSSASQYGRPLSILLCTLLLLKLLILLEAARRGGLGIISAEEAIWDLASDVLNTYTPASPQYSPVELSALSLVLEMLVVLARHTISSKLLYDFAHSCPCFTLLKSLVLIHRQTLIFAFVGLEVAKHGGYSPRHCNPG